MHKWPLKLNIKTVLISSQRSMKGSCIMSSWVSPWHWAGILQCLFASTLHSTLRTRQWLFCTFQPNIWEIIRKKCPGKSWSNFIHLEQQRIETLALTSFHENQNCFWRRWSRFAVNEIEYQSLALMRVFHQKLPKNCYLTKNFTFKRFHCIQNSILIIQRR